MANKELKLTVTYIKVLKTVESLEAKKLYANQTGIAKILRGEEDEETLPYKELVTYGTLLSYSHKKIARYIMMLHRYHLLDKVFDKKTEELYLCLSIKGKNNLDEYLKHHKVNFVRTIQTKKPNIVHIDK